MSNNPKALLLPVCILVGILVRVVVVAVAGSSLTTPWGGGGDTEQYVILGSNLRSGAGFSYANLPTAFRPPLYPIMLAGIMKAFGEHWVIALRLAQFLASLLTAWLCMRLATRLFGERAGRPGLLIALFLPTFIYFTGEILTECFAALLTALFLTFLLDSIDQSRTARLLLVGACAGLSALLRFNAAALCLVALAVAMDGRVSGDRLKRSLLVVLPMGILVVPWLARNALVFHGEALYSTHSGYAAVEGVVMPMGRAQGNEVEEMKKSLGWVNRDRELNEISSLHLPPEPEMNRQAWQVARRLWREQRWRLIPGVAVKLAAFWLSIDQVFWTHSFSMRVRVIRWVGVLVYLLCLILAILGWFRLRDADRNAARILLFYAAFVTILHLPLVMNTRLRVPFMDPLLASLAGGGYLSLKARAEVTCPR